MINCTQTVGYVKEDEVLSACPLHALFFPPVLLMVMHFSLSKYILLNKAVMNNLREVYTLFLT